MWGELAPPRPPKSACAMAKSIRYFTARRE
jgi:hypothetical protein